MAALSPIVRLQGISSRPVGAFVVFAGVALVVAGPSVVMLGISFNYFGVFHRDAGALAYFGVGRLYADGPSRPSAPA